MLVQPYSMTSSFPQPFPPTWAEAWGDDEYGLYADLTLYAEDFNKITSLFERGLRHIRGYEQHLEGVTQRLRWISPGAFVMGLAENQYNFYQQEVLLTKGYWLADTTVTEALWKIIMCDNESYLTVKNYTDKPFLYCSDHSAMAFVNKINQVFSGTLDGLVCRLPTEAEWENACRVGTTTLFSFGDTITSKQVNCGFKSFDDGQKEDQTISVKSLPANQWGLYEMHGNVWELCGDRWQTSNEKAIETMVVDPYHNNENPHHYHSYVIRGGSWRSTYRHVSSGSRFHNALGGPEFNPIGFRFCLGQKLRAK